MSSSVHESRSAARATGDARQHEPYEAPIRDAFHEPPPADLSEFSRVPVALTQAREYGRVLGEFAQLVVAAQTRDGNLRRLDRRFEYMFDGKPIVSEVIKGGMPGRIEDRKSVV